MVATTKEGKKKIQKKHLSDLEKGILYQAHHEGRSIRAIATILGVSIGCIHYNLQKIKDFGTLERQDGSGRPRKTTNFEDKKIIWYVRNNRFNDSNDIRKELRLQDVSRRTIRRRIEESGEFKSYWAAHKPFISETNRQRRVDWCIRARELSQEDWASVIWSDESPFVLRFNAKLRVWRLHNERYNPLVTRATVKHDKKIMVWGCFSWFGVGNLYRVEGILKKEQYLTILEEQMLPSARRLYPDENLSLIHI